MSSASNKKQKQLISWQRHWFNGLVANHPKFWQKLGNMESKLLEFDLEPIKVEKPVYVCGLARSGSTILLELLARHDDFVSHKYSDYPFLFTPYLWRMMQKILFMGGGKEQERFHGDRLKITANSPEAMEEVLWMHFFDHLHSGTQSDILDAVTDHAAFEKFYAAHLQKLLLQSKKPRYLAKGNYNVSRIEYLLKQFPDAKFLIPVRDPISHVESLLRQHQNFLEKAGHSKRALKHLERVGHFEFGADLRPVRLDDEETYRSITQLFGQGDMLRGYARYWAYIYSYVHQRYADHPNVMIYRYEDFCAGGDDIYAKICAFIDIETTQTYLEECASRIKAPDYYQSQLDTNDSKSIRHETDHISQLLGYKSL